MPTAPLRFQIETALDDLASHEGGMRFQPLAVVLAKQRWPELIAAERKNDLGLDAFVTSGQATDGIGRGVVCSITPTYGKIADDAKKVVKNFPNQIQQLVFATSGKVSTPRKSEWANQLRRDFGLELQVMSREDIVTSLTDPRNVGLCRTYLGLDWRLEPSLADLIATVREAAHEDVENWARRVVGRPLIELQSVEVDANGTEGDQLWSLGDIANALRNAHRVVLEAPAGRGKTTTLVQLAQGPLSGAGTAYFVDLPSWIQSGFGILPFIVGMPAFERRGLSSRQLATIERDERFYFLLNGWNEITASLSTQAAQMVKDLERRFPSAGILVATRAHYVPPPMPGGTRIRLRRIGPRARTEYLRGRLGDVSRDIIAAIEADAAMNELTRTPFVLSELASVFATGEGIPRNRAGLMGAVVRLHERSPDHEASLQAGPLRGMAAPFLESLAASMIHRGAVDLSDADARAVVHEVSDVLSADGQLLPRPAPADVLNELCAHHLLERFEYPTLSYRFEHQLFEEYYAARGLKRQCAILARAGFPAADRAAFIRRYVNHPGWTEPMQMLAEALGNAPATGGVDDEARAALSVLIDLAMSVDLVFAAHLACIGGVHSGELIGRALERRLREWHSSSDGHHRSCALGAMLASGLDVFRDIITPLLSSNDGQTRLRTHRLWPAFAASILGSDWRGVVGSWPDDARVDFVSEILHHRYVPDVVAFGLADPSRAVRETAIHALDWIGAEDEFIRAANGLDDEGFVRIVTGTSVDRIPRPLRDRARGVLWEHQGGLVEPGPRMRALVLLHELGEPEAIAALKRALEEVPLETPRELNEHVIVPALSVLRDCDPDWTSVWVARRIAEGTLWSERWSEYVTNVPGALRDELFTRLATQSLQHSRLEGTILIVTKSADARLLRRAFARLLEVQNVRDTATGRSGELEGEVWRQLERLLRTLPANLAIAGISTWISQEPELNFIKAFVHVFGRTAVMDVDGLELDDVSRQVLRDYLKRSLRLVLAQDDFAGSLKASFASVLSQVGREEDIDDLRVLVRADLDRVRLGRAARVRGERSQAADYAAMSYAHSYVRSIVTLLKGKADQMLFELLDEPEYETAIIEEFERQFSRPGAVELGRRPAFSQVWEARARRPSRQSEAPRRERVADAIRRRMETLEDSRSTDMNQHYLNARLKKLALGLAQSDPSRFANHILDVLSLPAEYDTHLRVDTLVSLLIAGVPLPAEKCAGLLDEPLERMKKWGIQDNDRWVIVRFLSVCPYLDPPITGIEKMRQVIAQAGLHTHEFRDLLAALGNSRFDGALDLMLELTAAPHAWQMLEHEWISALIDLDTPNAVRTLLGMVDPDLPSFPFALDWSASDKVAEGIAALAARDTNIDSRLRELSLVPLDESRRQLLAKALSARATPDAMLALLDLLDDAAHPRIPFSVQRCLEQAFVAREPSGDYAHAFALKPSASNRLRAKLFEMVSSDAQGKRSAYSLLGQIEEWRLEYGRPIDEPRHPDLESGLSWPLPEPQ